MRLNKRFTLVSVSWAIFLAISCLAPTDVLGCTTIQEGVIVYQPGHYLAGTPLKTGYDIFGYNYQAHMFNGSYANVYLGREGFPPYGGNDAEYSQRLADEGIAGDPTTKWYWPYRHDDVSMKWNDAWLSNEDCDSDGLLDRYYGFSSYVGSGAWLTNHMSGSYTSTVNGKEKEFTWTYFVKIVAVPSDATLVGSLWYDAASVEIGPVIWGEFATIQAVYNDPLVGAHGKLYGSPAAPGFGQYKPE